VVTLTCCSVIHETFRKPRELSRKYGHMSHTEVGQAVQPAFRRASFCAGGECIEVAQRDSIITLRDSTQPQGSMLNYASADWGSFVRRIKAGKLDGLGS